MREPDETRIPPHADEGSSSRETEQILRECEERFRALSEAAFEGLMITRGGMILEVNQALLDMTGYSRSELIGAQGLDLTTPEYRDAVIEHALKGSEEPYEAEFRKKDGGVLLVEVRGKPLIYMGEPARVGALVDITERKRADEALRESEQRFRVVADFAHDWEYWLSETGEFVYISPSCEQITGYSAEEFTRDPSLLVSIIHPDDYEVVAEHLKSCALPHEEYPLDFRIVRRDGEVRWVSHVCSRVCDQQGRCVGTRASNRDITDRKETEEALRDAEERLRLAIDTTHFGAFDFFPQTGRLIWSDYAKEHFGLPPDAHVDYDVFLKGLHPDDRERVDEIVQGTMRGESGGEYHTEYRTIGLQDGKERWLDARGRVFFDEQGRAVRFTGGTTDITDRKRAEEALEAERARLQAVLDSLPVAVWIADEKGTVIQTNRAAERVWGPAPTPYDIEEYAEYKGWWADTGEQIAPEDWALARAVLKGEVSTGEVIDIERFDGTRGTILNSASPIRDREGRIIGGVAAAQDITDLRIAEEQLRERAEELETVMDLAPVAIWIGHDPETRHITGNRMANEFYEAEAGENVSATVVPDRRFFSSGRELAPEELPMQAAAASNTDVRNVELDVLLPSGKWRYMLGSASPLRDPEGEVRGTVGAFMDITERKQAEEALTRALEESERDRRFITAIEGVSEAALAAGSLPEVLQAITIKIREGMGTHSCTLFLLDQQKREFEAVAACNIPEIVGFRVPAEEGFAGKILRERRTVYVRDVQHDPLVVNPHVKRAGVRSILGTPLIGRREVVGIVYLDEMEVREFTPEERRLFETLAARTALVIEGVQLMDELARNLHTLQQALLPPQPRINHGYVVASRYIPAYHGQEIGGDFFDVFTTEKNCAGVIIGDVSGKGIPAAALAAETRTMVRAFIFEFSSPATALAHANRALYPQDDESDLFVTLEAIVLDPEAGLLRYASAGHPPPCIYRAGRTVEWLAVGGPPVRLMPRLEYEEYEHRLAPGDKIVLFTDGLSEARSDSEMLGMEGIEALLREHGHLPAEEIANLLVATAFDWSGGVVRDDTAIIVIERTE